MLYFRAVRDRRRLRRAQQKIDGLVEDIRLAEVDREKRERDQRAKYTLALARLSAENRQLAREWTDRFFQVLKLNPVLRTSVEDDPEVSIVSEPTAEDLEGGMGYDATQLYLDRKKWFEEEGEELGLDVSEIHRRWREISPRVIEQCQQSTVFSTDEF